MSNRIKQDISIGANLKKLRLSANLSQQDVVTRLTILNLNSVSREILSQMELGKYSVRVSILLALKEIYNASFDDFFEGLSWRDIFTSQSPK